MDRIRRLQGSIQNYAWGSKTALAEFSGRPSPSDEPEAELWMGAHPSAPSQLRSEEDALPDPRLDEWIARDPLVTLGEATSERFGGELPFLFKVLAPDRALSIQVHPDRAQARAGFDRENAAGLSASAPERSYPDPNPKPELICALTRFDALCGFRELADIQSGLERLEIRSLAAILQALKSGGIAAGFRAALETDVAIQREIAEAARVRAGALAGDPACALVSVLAEQHPGDIGILAPIWMRLISLKPGQALFLEAGEIHSYISGVGIELMGNSDNVLRGGLTAKHVNVAELCDTLTFAQTPPRVLSAEPEKADNCSIYRTSAEEFALRVFNVSDEEPIERGSTVSSAEIWLCSAGRARLTDKQYESTLELARGEAAWIPASAGPHRVEGSGVFHVASVGPTP